MDIPCLFYIAVECYVCFVFSYLLRGKTTGKRFFALSGLWCAALCAWHIPVSFLPSWVAELGIPIVFEIFFFFFLTCVGQRIGGAIYWSMFAVAVSQLLLLLEWLLYSAFCLLLPLADAAVWEYVFAAVVFSAMFYAVYAVADRYIFTGGGVRY